MQKVEIPDTTVMGIAGKGELLALAIFIEEPIELTMSFTVAQSIADALYKAIDLKCEQGRAIG